MSQSRSSGEDDLTRLLVNELKIKRQELDASKENERVAIEKLARYKQRADEVKEKNKDLETQLENSFALKDDASKLEKYKQRTMQARESAKKAMAESETLQSQLAQATLQRDELQRQVDQHTHESSSKLAKYKQRWKHAEEAHQETLLGCEILRKELAEVKERLEANDPDQTTLKLEQHHQPVQDAEAGQRQTEMDHEIFRNETPGSQVDGLTTQRGQSTEIEKKIDETIYLALRCLPVVDGLPPQNSKPIAWNLDHTIINLPKDKRASVRNWRQQSFAETQVIFGESKQHGYLLRPRRCVKFDNEGNEIWFEGNPLHQLAVPFEAFLQKNGRWYYIGTYRAFYICEAPLETFSRWTDQDIAKLVHATICAPYKKTITDQKLYRRVRDMYSSGGLTAGYVGLQCVGFNHDLYDELCKVSKPVREVDMQGTEKKRASENQSGANEQATNFAPNKKRRTDDSKKEPFQIPIPS